MAEQWARLLLLGLRQGEVLGLKWENLDLDTGVLKVRTHLKREDGQFVLGNLKTHLRAVVICCSRSALSPSYGDTRPARTPSTAPESGVSSSRPPPGSQ